MKKQLIVLLMLLSIASIGQAQTQINETFDAKNIDQIDLFFTYPELVKIKVWDKEEVNIKGIVDIHNGEHDDDFKLSSKTNGNRLSIESAIKNIGKYRSFNVYSDDDKENTIVISKKGMTVSSGKKGYYSSGVNVSIVLEVTVPRSMTVMIDAKYGLVEVLESPKSMDIEARYGGIDVVINESDPIAFKAETQWGQIYSDLKSNIYMNGDPGMGKWIKPSASIKSGDQRLNLKSQYGNVYLRSN
ncbi:MAG: hypothetical protein ACI9Z3_000818 [Roseivirga sp.]|jgi:hypothetical protein